MNAQAERFKELIEKTDWDLRCWQAAYAVKPETAHQSLRTAVIETAAQGMGGVCDVADIVYHLAFSVNETAGDGAK